MFIFYVRCASYDFIEVFVADIMFQITIPVRDPEPPPTVPYKDEKTITDAKWIEGLASKREPKFRVATPDKRNIQDLSHSFEKHRLGKQQRLLQDLNLR